MQKILDKSKRLILNISTDFIRDMLNEIDWNQRLIWIVWYRWVWKTTLLLQYLKINKTKNSIYFSADHFTILEKWLYNLIEELYLQSWITTFFIDEIHKYQNWNQELKNIYDDFSKIKIVFSWSSSIDLLKWKYDLSRRLVIYKMQWFSFREYLNKVKNLKLEKINSENIIENYQEISENIYEKIWDEIIFLFKKYLEIGYYPFNFESEDRFWDLNKEVFYWKVNWTIDKIIYEDISNFYSLNTSSLENIKKIIIFFAFSKPWELSINWLKEKLQVSYDTVIKYLDILKDIWIINSVYPKWKIWHTIRKSKKILIDNSNLIYSINEEVWRWVEVWTVREIFFINQIKKTEKVFYSNIWDYTLSINWEDFIFEIWWKNKNKKQIKNIDNSFLVKDDILFWKNNIIPLWLFWFLY